MYFVSQMISLLNISLEKKFFLQSAFFITAIQNINCLPWHSIQETSGFYWRQSTCDFLLDFLNS